MKKVIFGILLLTSVSSFARYFETTDPISKLPKGTKINLLTDIYVQRGESSYISDRGISLKNRRCYLKLKPGVTSEGAVALIPSNDEQTLPVVKKIISKSSWEGLVTYHDKVDIMLEGSASIDRITCELKKKIRSNKKLIFEDMKDALPELEYVLPPIRSRTL